MDPNRCAACPNSSRTVFFCFCFLKRNLCNFARYQLCRVLLDHTSFQNLDYVSFINVHALHEIRQPSGAMGGEGEREEKNPRTNNNKNGKFQSTEELMCETADTVIHHRSLHPPPPHLSPSPLKPYPLKYPSIIGQVDPQSN